METTSRSDDEREALARLLGEELGWDWAGLPEEHIPSAQEVLLDLADAITAWLNQHPNLEPRDAETASLREPCRIDGEVPPGAVNDD